MSLDRSDDRVNLMDAYVDGLLSETERQMFEQQLVQDAALRGEWDGQKRIDAALCRLYAPPSGEGIVPTVMREAQSANGRTSGHSLVSRTAPSAARRLAVAAVLGFGVLGVWRIWTIVRPQPKRDIYAPQPWRSLEAVYRDEVVGGFKPDWVCASDQIFAQTYRKRLGQPLVLGQLPSGIAMVGLSYANSLTPRSIYMLAKVDQTPVLVFADRVAADTNPSVPPESGLRLFRHQIGEIVLYELSPLTEPRFLDHFRNPDSLDP